MVAMALLAWFSLLFLVVALVGSLTLAVLRGLRAWRAVKAFTGAAGSRLEEAMRTASEAEAHAVALSANAERLNAAVERLQESLARFAALRAAANDARGSLLAARRAVPRK